MNYGKVGVLMGGQSAEREISLMSGNGVLQALQGRGVDAHAFDTGKQSMAELAAQDYDRVFIALHGRFGEDGSIQGALELLGIPYTGSGVMASSVAMDKIFTKRLWLSLGLPTPDYRVLTPATDLDQIAGQLGLPFIVKPPHEGSTLGISKVEAGPDLLRAVQQAYALAAQFDDVVLAEAFVEGRELTVSIIDEGTGAYALPIIEIVAPGGNYDYKNKYFSDDTRYLCPAPIDAALTASIQKIALDAFHAVGCEGWGRVDFMLDRQNRPSLLEVNTSPGMTGHSLVPMAARAVGISYEDLCLRVLAGASLKIRQVKAA